MEIAPSTFRIQRGRVLFGGSDGQGGELARAAARSCPSGPGAAQESDGVDAAPTRSTLHLP